jgi:MinD-like ATPase involved in chromosome partitioning or flagellar assembly
LEYPVEQIDARLVEAQLEEHRSGIWVLSGQVEPPGIAKPITPRHAERILNHLGAMADYLLLDLGVGLSETNRHILANCDSVLVTTEPHRVALILAQALLEEMTLALNVPRHRISVVLINKAPSASTFTKEAIEGLLQHDLGGVVTPAPELAFQAAERGDPMVLTQPTTLVAQQIRTITESLV